MERGSALSLSCSRTNVETIWIGKYRCHRKDSSKINLSRKNFLFLGLCQRIY